MNVTEQDVLNFVGPPHRMTRNPSNNTFLYYEHIEGVKDMVTYVWFENGIMKWGFNDATVNKASDDTIPEYKAESATSQPTTQRQ